MKRFALAPVLSLALALPAFADSVQTFNGTITNSQGQTTVGTVTITTFDTHDGLASDVRIRSGRYEVASFINVTTYRYRDGGSQDYCDECFYGHDSVKTGHGDFTFWDGSGWSTFSGND